MLRSVLRTQLKLPCLTVRQYAFKSPSRAGSPENVDTLLAAYNAYSPHPYLALVGALQSPARPLSPRTVIRPAGIPQDEYDTWEPVATAASLATALDRAQDILASGQATPRPSDSVQHHHGALPTWVLLALLIKRPASPSEAFVVHRLVMVHPLSASPELTALVVTLAVAWLVQLRMYAPLQSVVSRLIKGHRALEPYQLSLLLRVLGQAEPHVDVQRMILMLLRLAIRNTTALGARTYRSLLNNPAISSAVARTVESHMRRLDYVPNLSHSRAFVRIYGEAGYRKRAARHWHRIRHGEFFGQVPWYISTAQFQSRTFDDYLKAFKNARKANLYLQYISKAVDRTQQASATDATQTGELPPQLKLRIAGTNNSDVWLRMLSTAARDASTDTDELLHLLNQGRTVFRNPSHKLFAISIVLKSLLRRQQYEKASPLLSEAVEHQDRFDVAELTIVIEAMTMLGRPDEAFRLLRKTALSRDRHSAGQGAGTSLIDTRTVNSFMISLLRIGRPDVVFYIWDTMPRIFGVDPDSTTLAILLKAARYARKYEGTLQVALQDFGLRRFLPDRVASSDLERAPQKLDREQALYGLERLLEPDSRRVVTGFWRGERAGVVALRLAWQVLVGNWPVLATLKPPVLAIRRNAAEQALSPVADLYHSIHAQTERGLSDESENSDGENLGRFPADEDGRTYFGIVPHDVMFRALLHLLAEEDQAGQIPLVLQWMRYLDVQPSPNTLATALVYWGEVSLQGPLIERFRAPRRSQYELLVRWITKWVGARRVPMREEMQRALKRVQYFREMPMLPVAQSTADKGWSQGSQAASSPTEASTSAL
ncbi:hypothetical protein OH77DRAFT_1426412 [Trametes cingulata]|nr:hypothetical protein OH77DRAFT_1426412 [Trametes cingulata]